LYGDLTTDEKLPGRRRGAGLAFDEDGIRQPAQPAFTAGIAKKPAHPAKRAGDGTIFVAGWN